MPTPVVMPQMGESIAEGTIVRWLKKIGDTVDRDEPLFEISTDKVDAEIPSPAAGVLTEITAHEGDTVAVNSVVANIAAAGEAAGPPATAAPPTAPAASQPVSLNRRHLAAKADRAKASRRPRRPPNLRQTVPACRCRSPRLDRMAAEQQRRRTTFDGRSRHRS